jgi:hypothetical protein
MRYRMNRLTFSLITLAIVSPTMAVDFVHEVAPILKKHCSECHMDTKHKGGFAMNTREELMTENDDGFVLTPGKSKESLIMHLVTSDDEDERMPPKGPGLNEKEVAVLAAWINAGAPWEPGFTFKKRAYEPPLKLTRPKLPAPQNKREHPIDRILDAHLAKTKVARPASLDEAAFVRRVHLDLTGLLPTADALHAHLADKSPDKRTKLIHSLLNDNQAYASHWLTFWNDLLRNDYAGTGYIDGGRSQISQWLYRSLYENKPYNQFASQLIAPSKESAGFANGIKWRGEVSAGQTVPIQYAQSVGQTFLGINLKCASCHDSFTDQWKLTDSYGLAAAFSPEKIEIARCDKPTGKIAEPYWLYPELGKIDASKPPAERLKQVAELTTMRENGRFSRTIVNRLWHRLMGRGIVHPVDAMGTEPWNEALLDYLAIYLIEQNYDQKKVLAHICESQAYQAKTHTLASGDESKWTYAGPRAKRMTSEEFVDALWQLLGTAPAKADFVPANLKQPLRVRAALMKSDMLMRSLGRPNREQIVTSRPNDLTTLEAMDLNNANILAAKLSTGADNILKQHGADSSRIVDTIYFAALSRQPTGAEKQVAIEVLGAKATAESLQDFLWTILMLPEFQLIR